MRTFYLMVANSLLGALEGEPVSSAPSGHLKMHFETVYKGFLFKCPLGALEKSCFSTVSMLFAFWRLDVRARLLYNA